jgi:hypothetical protein
MKINSKEEANFKLLLLTIEKNLFDELGSTYSPDDLTGTWEIFDWVFTDSPTKSYKVLTDDKVLFSKLSNIIEKTISDFHY